MLVKLTGIPHPEINGGVPWSVYVDPTRVLLITRATHRQTKLLAAEERRALYDDMRGNVEQLNLLLTKKWPNEIDTQQASERAKELHMMANAVNDACVNWSRSYRAEEVHPAIECTELQLACGTGMEHGVMLARVWVSESPEQVAAKLTFRALSPSREPYDV